jgi:hypothetical protein
MATMASNTTVEPELSRRGDPGEVEREIFAECNLAAQLAALGWTVRHRLVNESVLDLELVLAYASIGERYTQGAISSETIFSQLVDSLSRQAARSFDADRAECSERVQRVLDDVGD